MIPSITVVVAVCKTLTPTFISGPQPIFGALRQRCKLILDHFHITAFVCLPPIHLSPNMSDPQQQQQQSSSAAAQQQQQQQPSRFKAPSNLTTQERLSTNTVGLVALSDFRKRRAEVLEQQEREAREALRSGTNTPKLLDSRSRSATPNNDGSAAGGGGGGGGGDQQEAKRAAKKVKKQKKALVSFGDDDEEEDGPAVVMKKKKRQQTEAETEEQKQGSNDNGNGNGESEDSNSNPKKPGAKITANAAVGVVPRALTKAALRREAAERDALRKEFLILQEAVKNTEIAIPFVFYDGTNTPGGTVRVRKGEFVWVFLDKGRKVGAELAMGGDKNAHARRDWARVGVDDLLLVRGTMIIPHVSNGQKNKVIPIVYV